MIVHQHSSTPEKSKTLLQDGNQICHSSETGVTLPDPITIQQSLNPSFEESLESPLANFNATLARIYAASNTIRQEQKKFATTPLIPKREPYRREWDLNSIDLAVVKQQPNSELAIMTKAIWVAQNWLSKQGRRYHDTITVAGSQYSAITQGSTTTFLDSDALPLVSLNSQRRQITLEQRLSSADRKNIQILYQSYTTRINYLSTQQNSQLSSHQPQM